MVKLVHKVYNIENIARKMSNNILRFDSIGMLNISNEGLTTVQYNILSSKKKFVLEESMNGKYNAIETITQNSKDWLAVSTKKEYLADYNIEDKQKTCFTLILKEYKNETYKSSILFVNNAQFFSDIDWTKLCTLIENMTQLKYLYISSVLSNNKNISHIYHKLLEMFGQNEVEL
jgi:hypothetical protein